MCGIVTVLNLDKIARAESAAKQVHLRFEDQKDRGTQGFGLIAAKDNGTYRIERSTELVKASFDLYLAKEPFIFFHHRQPSSSDNKISQTHPLVIDHPQFSCLYAVIHNGVIHNADELYDRHVEAGYKYQTVYTTPANLKKFNDSEALAFELASYLEGKQRHIEAIGSAAFVCLQIDRQTGKISHCFFGRNSNPLKLSVSQHKIILASEGKGNDVDPDQLYKLKWGDWKITKSKLAIASYSSGVTIIVPDKKHQTSIDDHGSYRVHSSQGRGTSYCSSADNYGYNRDLPTDTAQIEDAVDEAVEVIMDDIDTRARDLLDDYAKNWSPPSRFELRAFINDMIETLLDGMEEMEKAAAEGYATELKKEMEDNLDADFHEVLDRVAFPEKLHAN